MATTQQSKQQDPRRIRLGSQAYRWDVEITHGWRGFEFRTIFRVRIEPARRPRARITAYLVEQTTNPNAPLLGVDDEVVRELIHHARLQGWSASRERPIALYQMENWVAPIFAERLYGPAICV